MLGYAYHHWAVEIEQVLGSSQAAIPLDDQSAYLQYPQYRWMFDKLRLCWAQGLTAHPHGVEPAEVDVEMPVFSKPIMNLWGLSTGACRLDRWELSAYRPGHFWMPVLPEPQLSTDLVVDRGRVLWRYSMRPVLDAAGSFVRWETAAPPSDVTRAVEAWVSEHLADFRGVLNVETRGQWLIEAPPRMAVQFLDFYGSGWLASVAALYNGAAWLPPGPASRRGRSLVLRLPAAWADTRPYLRDSAGVASLERHTGCTVYLPWQDGQRLGDANDDGRSFRFALVNVPDGADAETMAFGLLDCLDGLPRDAALSGIRAALR